MQAFKKFWSTRSGKIATIVAGISIFCCFCVLVAALSPSTTPPASQANPTDASNTAIAFAWTSVAQTATAGAPTATLTPVPPTDTPQPTITSTPEPQPIILTGSGDSVIDVQKWPGVALFKATYTGGSNFAVINYGPGNNYIDLLVNTVGSYSGNQLIDIYDQDNTVRFEITASGAWEIQILPISQLRKESIPGVISGTGDDVIAFLQNGAEPDLLKADASQGSGNFAVWSLSLSSFDLVFNEIAPYTGTGLLDNGTFLIQVKSTGPWSIEVTTK